VKKKKTKMNVYHQADKKNKKGVYNAYSKQKQIWIKLSRISTENFLTIFLTVQTGAYLSPKGAK